MISFGSILPFNSVPTGNLVVDQDPGGNVNANILLGGTNWISGINNFFVANTLWNPSSANKGVGNALKLSTSGLGAVDTGIVAPMGLSNSVYFGVSIPDVLPRVYSQNIVVENSC